MKVRAWNRSPKHINAVEIVTDLGELFSQSDHISINLKTTLETKSLIKREHLFSMNGGYIVNQADRQLISFDDLAAAIKAGHVGGYSESLDKTVDRKLSRVKEVIPFPAQAWFTDHSLQKLRETWVKNIEQAIYGSYPNLIID